MLSFSFVKPSSITGKPWCIYPKDYGYTAERVEETDSGISVNITRNKKYGSSGRPGSPDIDNLRVQITYHSSDMLQFKVQMFLSSVLPQHI